MQSLFPPTDKARLNTLPAPMPKAKELIRAARAVMGAFNAYVTSYVRQSPSHLRGGAIDIAFKQPGAANFSDFALPKLRDTLELLDVVANAWGPQLIWVVESNHIHIQDPRIEPSPVPRNLYGTLLLQADAFSPSELAEFKSLGGQPLRFPAFVTLPFQP